MLKGEPARLTLLHVYPTEGRKHKTEVPQQEVDAMAEFKAEMDSICHSMQPDYANIEFQCDIISGDVNREIRKYLNRNECDLVILGINSNGSDNVTGKHAAAILESSGIPVMVVPNKIQNGELVNK